MTVRKARDDRALLGSRFKILLNDAGLSPEAAVTCPVNFGPVEA
jgi:hypothetical protein